MTQILPRFRYRPLREEIEAEIIKFFDGAAQIFPTEKGWAISLLGPAATRTFKVLLQGPKGFVDGIELEWDEPDAYTRALIGGLGGVLTARWCK